MMLIINDVDLLQANFGLFRDWLPGRQLDEQLVNDPPIDDRLVNEQLINAQLVDDQLVNDQLLVFSPLEPPLDELDLSSVRPSVSKYLLGSLNLLKSSVSEQPELKTGKQKKKTKAPKPEKAQPKRVPTKSSTVSEKAKTDEQPIPGVHRVTATHHLTALIPIDCLDKDGKLQHGLYVNRIDALEQRVHQLERENQELRARLENDQTKRKCEECEQHHERTKKFKRALVDYTTHLRTAVPK